MQIVSRSLLYCGLTLASNGMSRSSIISVSSNCSIKIVNNSEIIEKLISNVLRLRSDRKLRVLEQVFVKKKNIFSKLLVFCKMSNLVDNIDNKS